MVSTLTLIDSLSETGAPDGMICLHQVAIDIANELFPEPTIENCCTTEKTAIDIDMAKKLRQDAEQAHLKELSSLVAQGRITAISATTRAPVVGGNHIYIRKYDACVYRRSINLSPIHDSAWLARQHNKKSDHIKGDWVTLHEVAKHLADTLSPEGKATARNAANSAHWWAIYDEHFDVFEKEIKDGEWWAISGNGAKTNAIDYTIMIERSNVADYCKRIGANFPCAQIGPQVNADTALAEGLAKPENKPTPLCTNEIAECFDGLYRERDK